MIRRWLPTLTRPLVAGAVAIAAAFGAERLGLIPTSDLIASFVDPCIGLFVVSVVQKPKS